MGVMRVGPTVGGLKVWAPRSLGELGAAADRCPAEAHSHPQVQAIARLVDYFACSPGVITLWLTHLPCRQEVGHELEESTRMIT